MEEKKTNKLIILAFIIIIVGVIMVVTKGFKVELKYEASNQIELSIEKEFELNDVKNIAKDVLGEKKLMVQKVEAFEDRVSIRAEEITEDEKTAIVEKINEKYELSLLNEDIDILSVPHTRIRDLLIPFIIPFIMVICVIYIYFLVRFIKIGFGKVTFKLIEFSLLPQLILLSIIAIFRIPFGRITIPLILGIFSISIIYITYKFEKDLKEIKLKEENGDKK